ncbi:hypothetical protein [Pontivivens ytuae]|uniref:Uncharacterized protein n=1 Tax=Pontivivens ytuae TaxID=2789856 RepID=A0A7S9LST9_9RHOB|nr:hypothetical protein [Pontivivens ytuae]QPH54661.1 hypothetical protein I0K15_02430 [Pontivivens ytuae]
MAEDKFKLELAELMAKHGVGGLPQDTVRGPSIPGGVGTVASYIKEIITDSQAFDETVLNRVVSVLKTK